MTTLSDADIVRRVLAGEPELFELLVRRHNQRLYRTARAIVRNDAEAEDVMQQAYARAHEHLQELHGDAAFSTWLVRITITEALMRLRKDRKLSLIDDDAALEAMMTREITPPSPEQQASTHELYAFVEQAVDALPELYRVVFTLREVEEMSTEETAAALSLSADVVKQRLHHARGLVQDQLAKRVLEDAKAAFRFEAPRCNRITTAVMARVLSRGISPSQ